VNRLLTPERRTIPAIAADLLLASIILMIGSSVRGTLLFIVGLPLTVAGFALTMRALWMRDFTPREEWARPVEAALSVMADVGLLGPALPAPLWYEVARRLYFVCGIIAIGVVAAGGAPARRASVRTMIVAGVALHLLAPIAVSNPQMDVWALTQAVVHGFLHGVQPYTVRTPDFYKGAVDYGYTLSVYPYMPATLLVFAPAVAVFGDFRALLAICFPVTIVLLRAACRVRARAGGRQLMDLITLAFMLHPRGLSFTAMGWTESVMIVAAAAAVFLALRARGQVGAATFWFLLPALKQYVLVPPVLYALMMSPRPRPRTLLIAVGVAAATVIPFAIWAWAPTLDGIVFQFRDLRAPRLDSTSFVAIGAVFTGATMSRWWSVIAQAAVGGIGYWRLRNDGLPGMLLASAAALYATFLFGWQAFINYYYFVSVLLLLTVVAASVAGRVQCAQESRAL
jgi:hypothetical protein